MWSKRQTVNIITHPFEFREGDEERITIDYANCIAGTVTVYNAVADLNESSGWKKTSVFMTSDLNANGTVVIPLNIFTKGYYGFYINFTLGDYTSEALMNFNVNERIKVQTRIIAPDVSTTYGTSKYITITLKDTDHNVNLPLENVTLTFNGKTYNKTTNANGQVKIAIPKNLAVKSCPVTFSFDGNNTHALSNGASKVVVKRATPKLTAKSKSFKSKDKTRKYIVTLKTDKKAVYKKAKITIKLTLKVKKKTYTKTLSVKTNNNGQAIFKLSKLTKKGKYSATVKFAGDSKYKAVSKKVKITI